MFYQVYGLFVSVYIMQERKPVISQTSKVCSITLTAKPSQQFPVFYHKVDEFVCCVIVTSHGFLYVA